MSPSTNKRRLLIVDDETDLVDMLAMRLEATGLFEIQKAQDGFEGLARAAEWKPDIVLLDNVMPGLDGWEVCRRLRADSRFDGLLIAMMTAGTPQKSQQRARDFHADALILKPYDQSDVINTLKGLIRAAQEA
jgi:two-component system, OmpR family, alkaline phosphatase synthesis response regulator PhoP